MQDRDRYDYEEEVNPDYAYEQRAGDLEPTEEQNEEPPEKRHSIRLLTSIQIFGSLAVLAAVLILRLIGGDSYQKVRTWYFSAVNDSLIAEEQTEQVKRTVVGLWNELSAGGLKGAESEGEASSAAAAASAPSDTAPSATSSETVSAASSGGSSAGA
jgi:hypothetical protein